MKWIKKGLLFRLEHNFEWMNSHAQVPTLLVKEDRLRVYFATRPRRELSLTTYVDIDIDDFSKVIYLNPKPILELGEPGFFDEHGIMPGSVIEKDELVYLYYSGWSRCTNVPYNNFTGLAISKNGGKTFSKYSKEPVINRTPSEIYSSTSPCVFYHDGLWNMWYSSGIDWIRVNDKYEHTYDIKYAFSKDGLTWNQTNEIAIEQHDKYEAITKPAVLELDGIFHMWYSYRGSKDFRDGLDSYRIGYATSKDLKAWKRNDENSGIDISESGWDSKMIAYPCIVQIKDQIIMVYNGNNFGEEGFGYAILER